ncbi:MAG: molybdenum cofactor biosynthesis protein MoaE [Betaproteobacteria bacterium]|jgi:molybdopterin synthase catalytic subunit|nr:molybdenum cofactor biosynthesis protein MoaE [Polynucleobacter sp.]NBY64597.1 molybdenum cofactor biosynthesis protein MoaE [Betaproteobacteria bacterium]
MKIQIQEEDFDVSKELELLRVDLPQIGGINVFVGTVRDEHFGQKIEGMVLEHYPGMTEKSLANILDQAQARWQILNATVIHRVGDLRPGEQIVLVAVASSHRGDAFAACEFIMDYLKTSAPFWKKELTPNGAHWVDARITDDERLKKWQI